MPRSRRLVAPAAIAAVLLLGPALAGCFQNPIESLVENSVEDAVEGAIEGATGVDVEAGATSIPDDFPSSVILIDGEVLSASSITIEGEKTWSIVIAASSDVADVFADARGKLTGAGFEETMVQESGDQASGIFSGEFGVLVNVGPESGDTVATYIVSPATTTE